MNAFNHLSIRAAGLALTGLTLILASQTLAAESGDIFRQPESYIKVTGYGTSHTGNDAAFKAGTQAPNGAGIEDLRYTYTTDNDVAVKAEGRALVGSEDYLAKLNLSKDEVGSVEFGYKRFRTFYDGAGGFFPTNGRFLALTNRELFVDRGRFWAEAKIARPNAPEITLRYSNELRDGRKDSTIWGSSSLTGLPYNVAPNPINPTRKFTPSYLDLNERNEQIEASVAHTFGSTKAEVRLVQGTIDNSNTRWVMNYPGQSVPFPTPAAAALALLDPVNWNNQQQITTTDGLLNKHSTVSFKTETAIGEKIVVRTAGSYQRVRADLSGDRVLVAWTPSATGINQVTTTNYTGLTGKARVNVYTGLVAVEYKPTDTLFAKIGVRADESYNSARDNFNVLSTTSTTPRTGWSKEDSDSLTPVVELRYAGIRNVSLYASGSLHSVDGVKRNTSAYNHLTAASGTLAINANDESRDQFTVGALWRPNQKFDARLEVYSKVSATEATGFETATGDYFRIDSDIVGLKASSSVKPIETVSLTARYVYQQGDMETTGYQPTFPAYESGDATNHSIGGTLSWNPTAQVYVQLNGNMVFNRLRTGYGRVGYVPATSTVSAYDGNKVLQDSNNDYVTGSIVAGFVVDSVTDASIQFSYFDADNSNAVLASTTMPYGADVREYMVAAGVKRKLNEKMILNAKVGYIENVNGGTGGYTNFKGPLACVSLDYAL